MTRFRYAFSFALAVLLLTASALFVFARISDGAAVQKQASAMPARETPTPANAEALIAPSAADYARFASEDKAWREKYARPVSAEEWRARGDGRPSPRQVMEDKVFRATRAGDRSGAIRELERWVTAHPRDKDGLLSLARLLNEAGRRDESLKRYRQILDLNGRE
jgi:Flp pilus assembly protein TadD